MYTVTEAWAEWVALRAVVASFVTAVVDLDTALLSTACTVKEPANVAFARVLALTFTILMHLRLSAALSCKPGFATPE